MSPTELCDLADDIAANGLRDAVTLTPDGKLLDGRNRALACIMAGTEIPADKIVVHNGDPWLFSISRNARSRHMTTDQIAMVVASLATRPLGANQYTKEGVAIATPSVAEAAWPPGCERIK
jgi:hypothetical protein